MSNIGVNTITILFEYESYSECKVINHNKTCLFMHLFIVGFVATTKIIFKI